MLAAVHLGRSWPDAAEVAIERAEQVLDSRPADRRRTAESGGPEDGRGPIAGAGRSGPRSRPRRVLELLPRLTLSQRDRAPELLPMVESHLGLFALWDGAVYRAMAALAGVHGAAGCARPGRAHTSRRSSWSWRTASASRLSWRRSPASSARPPRHAAEVLTARPADSTGSRARCMPSWRRSGRTRSEARPGETAVRQRECSDRGARRQRVAPRPCRRGSHHGGQVGRGVSGETRIGRDLTQLCRYAAVYGFFADELRAIRGAEAELNTGQPAGALRSTRRGGRSQPRRPARRATPRLALGPVRPRPLPRFGSVRRGNRRLRSGQVQLELLKARLAQGPGDQGPPTGARAPSAVHRRTGAAAYAVALGRGLAPDPWSLPTLSCAAVRPVRGIRSSSPSPALRRRAPDRHCPRNRSRRRPRR